MGTIARTAWGLPLAVVLVLGVVRPWHAEGPAKELDPATWGSDHVGKPLPDFPSGDECLFCHRKDVGPTWPDNRHGLTLRPAGESPALEALRGGGRKGLADEVDYLMGGGHRQRFLKRGTNAGKLDLLSVAWVPGEGGKFVDADRPTWDAKAFGDRCAGCHATGVHTRTRAFTALSLDCFVCHGEIPEEHTEKPELAFFSKKREVPARVVISTCSQCHLRAGTSRSTGLPYPNQFVPGDNLFRDYRVDLSEEAIAKAAPDNAHILRNVRDVVVLGQEKVTCLSCHTIHKPSGKRHRAVPGRDLCLTCHKPGSRKHRIPYEAHSALCGY